MRDLINLIEDAAELAPEVVDDDGDMDFAKCAYFDEDGEAYIRYWQSGKGAIVIQAMHSSATVRGRQMLLWLKNAYKKPIKVVEVTWDAAGFWDTMLKEGIIADWTEDPFKGRSKPLPELA